MVSYIGRLEIKASAYTYFLDLSDEARILYSSDSIVDIRFMARQNGLDPELER